MTKEVLISISGLQYDVEDSAPIESVNVGRYYKKNGKHYVLYEEVIGESESRPAVCSCVCRITENSLDIIKKGAVNTHLAFELNKSNVTYYETGVGELFINVQTTGIGITECDTKIEVILHYDLDVNYNHISECKLTMAIEAIENSGEAD